MRLKTKEGKVCIPIGKRTLTRVYTPLGMKLKKLLHYYTKEASPSPSDLHQARDQIEDPRNVRTLTISNTRANVNY